MMLDKKKGMLQALLPYLGAVILTLLTNVWVLLGIAIFVVVVFLLFMWTLGKLLGIGAIIAGVISMFRFKNWYIFFALVLLGIFLLWNPLEITTLTAVPLSMGG